MLSLECLPSRGRQIGSTFHTILLRKLQKTQNYGRSLYRVLYTYSGAPGRLILGNDICGQVQSRNKNINQTKDLGNRHAEQKRIGLESALR